MVMLARVQSFYLQGIDGRPCEIETDVDEGGLAKDLIVGLPDAAVRESLERVRAAVANAGYRFPGGRLLVNLAPADVRKEGPVYDLPIAVGLLMADGAIDPRKVDGTERGGGIDPRRYLFAGELALDGRVRPVRGALALAILARSMRMRGVVLPGENATEAAVVEGIEVIGVETLAEVVSLLNGQLEASPHPPVDVAGLIERTEAEVDFGAVKGQESVKRAITVAAAGGHNLLMLGPAGTGKTMMAKALPGILPPLSADEALEVTRIYSAVGLSPGGAVENDAPRSGLVTCRPVRTPHHTASSSAVIGGGAIPKPGEISLAHRGVLFLDELPEFPRPVLDTLRQPLEDGRVTIARAHSAARFPASFMLVAAMNPTPKGDMPTDAQGRRDMERYLGRLSRPLIDRIDIHVEAPAVPWKELSAHNGASNGTTSAQMRDLVLRARGLQRSRQGRPLNADLSGRQLDEHAPLAEDARSLLGSAITELNLSARAYDKIRRVARTIADIDGSDGVGIAQVAEAVQYRLLDRSL
jgi:magnesium chelatase family protein